MFDSVFCRNDLWNWCVESLKKKSPMTQSVEITMKLNFSSLNLTFHVCSRDNWRCNQPFPWQNLWILALPYRSILKQNGKSDFKWMRISTSINNKNNENKFISRFRLHSAAAILTDSLNFAIFNERLQCNGISKNWMWWS